MKNIIILFILVLLPSQLSAQTFGSEAEIDAYYDAQLEAIDRELEAKNRAVEEQLQADLDAISAQTDADIWAMYKRVYGDMFEMVRPFLPESNPDPAFHAGNLMGLDEAAALQAISNIAVVNEPLAEQVKVIYYRDREVVNSQKPSAWSLYEHIDTLPLSEANTAMSDLELWEPALYREVKALFDLAYPNGRPGTAEFEAYRNAEAQRIISSIPDPEPVPEPVYTPPVKTQVPEVAQAQEFVEAEIEKWENPVAAITSDETATDTSAKEIDLTVYEESDTNQPEIETAKPEQPGFLTRVFNFIKSWF